MTRKRRDLTDEEKVLWEHVAKKVKPLKAEKKRVLPSATKKHPSPPLPSKRQHIVLPPEPPAALGPNTSGVNHRIQRIRKVDIEGRLDLHGLTRDQARTKLFRFLTSRQERHCLWVLVITGKGRRRLDEEGVYEAPSPNTLRNLVPQWLEESFLRSVVSAYTTAKPQDGGSGALYVRLKRLV